MDPIARFSVTDMKTADRMSELLLSLEGITSDSSKWPNIASLVC